MMKKYLVLFLVVLAVVFLVVYLIFVRKVSKIAPGSEPVEVPKTWQIKMTGGAADFYELGGKTKVTLNLPNLFSNVPVPAHIHSGSCPQPGAIKYPLTGVVDGGSETVLETTIDALKASLPLAVNVHKSAVDMATSVSCGDLK